MAKKFGLGKGLDGLFPDYTKRNKATDRKTEPIESIKDANDSKHSESGEESPEDAVKKRSIQSSSDSLSTTKMKASRKTASGKTTFDKTTSEKETSRQTASGKATGKRSSSGKRVSKRSASGVGASPDEENNVKAFEDETAKEEVIIGEVSEGEEVPEGEEAFEDEESPEGKETLEYEEVPEGEEASEDEEVPEGEESSEDEKSPEGEEVSVYEEAPEGGEASEGEPEGIIEEYDSKDRKNSEAVLRISLIEPGADQPRKSFDREALEQLSDSIKKFGVLQPIVVKKVDEHYEIVAGERRWRAARMAGLKEIPAVIQNFTEREVMEISLIENIQRENLNPVEEAKAFNKLITEYSLTQDELAERVSKSRTAITNSMRLLKLCEPVQNMLAEGKITAGHARALLSIEDPAMQKKLAEQIIENSLSVRDIEKMVKNLQNPKVPPKPKEKEDEALTLIYKDMEDHMKNALGTKVLVNRKDHNRGKIEIEYYSGDELERLYDLLRNIGG